MEGFAGLPEKDQPSNLPQASSVRPDADINDGLLAAQAEEIASLHGLLDCINDQVDLPEDLQQAVDAVANGCTNPACPCLRKAMTELADAAAALMLYGQHLNICATRICATCGEGQWMHDHTMDLDEVTCIQRDGVFAPKACDCGLTRLLTAGGSEAERAGMDDGHLAAQAKTHEQEVDDWIRIATKNAEDANRRIHALETELTTLRSTHATLQRALQRYGQHLQFCPARNVREDGPYATLMVGCGPCECGFQKALNGAPGTE